VKKRHVAVLDPPLHWVTHSYVIVCSTVPSNSSLYFGVGRGLGGLLGAYLWDAIGAVDTFRLFGLISASMALAYAVAAFVMRSKKSDKFEINDPIK
jgi:hypothetical protein